MNRDQLHEKQIRHFQMEAVELVGGLKDEQWQPVVLVPLKISRNIGPIKSIKFHWLDPDLIPRLLEIFERLKTFMVILLSVKNDAYSPVF